MKSAMLLIYSVFLLVRLSNSQAPGDYINCDLQYGTGCNVQGPRFYLDYQFTHPGPSSQCRMAYNLRVSPDAEAEGFECSFVTDGTPVNNTYRYTISHNSTRYWDSRTAHIRVYGDHALFRMQDGNGIFDDNWWYYPNTHAPYGYSFANYRFEQRYLRHYGSNSGVQHQSGHNRGFRPLSRETYIGLNKMHDTTSFAGYGLCQIYCFIIRPSNSPQASSDGTSSEDPLKPFTPSPPPPRPSGRVN